MSIHSVNLRLIRGDLSSFWPMGAFCNRLGKILPLLLVFACIGFSSHAQMALAPLTSSEIRTFLLGQRMVGEYPSGAQWAEQFNMDGTSVYVEGGQPVEGQMSFNGATLCFTYPNVAQMGGCFEVWKRGLNCFDFYAVGKDVNFATLDDRRFGRGWSARGWLMGQEATCVTEQIS